MGYDYLRKGPIMKQIYLKIDECNRIALTKATKNPYKIYKVRLEGETIILEPVIEASQEQYWLQNLKTNIF